MLSELIKRALSKFIKPSIVFESKPLYSDNTKAVYDEMVRRGYDKKYRLVWCKTWNEWGEIKNGQHQSIDPHKRGNITQKIQNYSVFNRTKCIICCNTFLPSSGDERWTFGEGQKSFYLSHGTPLKSTKAYYTSPGGIDYAIAASEDTRPVMAREFSIDLDKYYATGFPRNDVFAREHFDLNKIFESTYRKIIIWYPTYRQSKSIILSGNTLPIIHDEMFAAQLNSVAKENNVLIVIKPHFIQNTEYLSNIHLSNIRLIDDSFFTEKKISSYEMLASSDALITDYSSVYFDYTLRDKPIAAVWEDIEDYRKNPGFALDVDKYFKGAEKIYTIEDLCAFVQRVAGNEDILQKERREIRDLVNISTDGNNTKRVVDFIIEKASL